LGVLEETVSAEHNDQYFYFDDKWKKYDGFQGFPISTIKEAAVILNPLGFSFYFPNKSILFNENDGLSGIQTSYPYMYPDKNGIVWIYFSDSNLPPDVNIGTYGINVWDGNKLHKITTKERLSSNTVLKVLEDSKGRIWLPTDKGLDLAKAISLRKDQWVIKINPIKRKDNKNYSVSSVLETKTGEIFTWQNYVRPGYSNIPRADFFLGKVVGDNVVEIPNPLPDNLKKIKYQKHNLCELPNGNLLLASSYSQSPYDLESSKSNLLIYDSSKWTEPLPSWNVPEKILSYVGTLFNKMYFLSPGHFYIFDGNKFIDLSDSVNSKADFRILKEANIAGTTTNIQAGNYLYIRLRLKGLAIFDGTNLNFYTTKNGLPTANIYNPATDLKGNVYFIHNLGGLIINGERFNTYYNDNSSFTGQSAFSQDRNGNILTWYTNLGFYVDRETKFYGSIKLSSIKVNSSQYYYNKPSSYSYSDNSFIYNYSVLNYKDPKSAIYQHKLEGYDLEWSKPSNLQFSEYQNVPPGNYIFKVMAIDKEGSKTNQVTYAFTISPPYWKTWWAYTFYVFLFGGFLYSIRKFELKRQRKNTAIRESQLRAEAAELQAKAAEAQSKVIQAENDRKSSELEEARQLQLSMLPTELPKIDNLEIAVYMKTATEVGGDYYDFHVGMDGTLTVVVGDATGHGMKAGTMVTATKSLFNILAPNPDILSTFSEISRVIKGMKFHQLSMCLLLLKIKGEQLFVSSAAMPPALIYRKKSQVIEEIFMKGMPLGAMNDFPYSLKESKLQAGDTILLLSDGLPELTNDNNEMYGYDKTKTEFHSVGEKEPEEIVDHLKNSASQWVNGKDPDDDVAFVVIKVK
jgi:serine phosphatase RsbU (regulator of sigma subunit)